MSLLLPDAVSQITGILGKISELTSDYNEAMRLMSGLSGALVVLTEFIERRIGDANEIDPKAMSHLIETLAAIEAKIDDIHATIGKKWACFPYGKWYVYGAPVIGPCFGRAGSTKLIKQLSDLEGDLAGDIKFLELQMTANAVQSLSAISSVQGAIAKVFDNRETREFWIASFGDEFTVSQDDVADRLLGVLRGVREQHIDSELSRAYKLCSFLAADLARAAVVTAGGFSNRLGGQGVESWILGSVAHKARTVLVPGHVGPVRAITCSEGFLITGGDDASVKVFALSDSGVPMHRATLVGHNDSVTCVDVCGDDGMVVSGSRDGFIRTWSLYGGESVGCYPVSSEVRAMACASEDILYACAAPTMSINVRNAKTGSVVSKMFGHAGGVTSIAVDESAEGGTRIFSSGADRSLKQWSLPSHEQVALVPQAHSIWIRHVLRHDSFLASVSNRDVRFYSPDDINAESVVARVCERTRGSGEVCGACVVRTRACVVLATSERFAESANARLHAVFPSDEGAVRYQSMLRTDAGEAPSCLASYNGLVYVGFTSGSVRWFSLGESGFSELGSVGAAMSGGAPALDDVATPPLMSARGDRVVTAHPPNRLAFHPGGTAVKLPEPATAVSHSEHGTGWVVGAGQKLLVFGDDGERTAEFGVGGTVSSVHASLVRRKLFMDIRRKHNVRTIVVCDSSSGVCNDLLREPCSPDSMCRPGLVLNDRYMVWPGYFDGTLAVMDTVELRSHTPLRYSHLEVDPITDIATSSAWFVTLHGGLDVLMWNDVKDGPRRCVKTFQNPVASVVITAEGRMVAGCADGTVFADDEDGKVFVDHSLGPVTVVNASGGGFYSLGVESSLVRHHLG